MDGVTGARAGGANAPVAGDERKTREAVILAGGLGTRLRRVVPDLPKVLAPVGGTPFLEILLTLLERKGFRRVVLSLGHMAEKIVSVFGSRFRGMELCHEVEESPLGTGGAMYRALRRCRGGHAFVINGDTYLDFERERIDDLWRREREPIIVACRVADTARYGRIESSDGLAIGFREKGAGGSGLISSGYYVFPTDLLDGFGGSGAFSLENDFLGEAVRSRRFRVFVSRGAFVDIGTPEDYARAQVTLGRTAT